MWVACHATWNAKLRSTETGGLESLKSLRCGRLGDFVSRASARRVRWWWTSFATTWFSTLVAEPHPGALHVLRENEHEVLHKTRVTIGRTSSILVLVAGICTSLYPRLWGHPARPCGALPHCRLHHGQAHKTDPGCTCLEFERGYELRWSSRQLCAFVFRPAGRLQRVATEDPLVPSKDGHFEEEQRECVEHRGIVHWRDMALVSGVVHRGAGEGRRLHASDHHPGRQLCLWLPRAASLRLWELLQPPPEACRPNSVTVRDRSWGGVSEAATAQGWVALAGTRMASSTPSLAQQRAEANDHPARSQPWEERGDRSHVPHPGPRFQRWRMEHRKESTFWLQPPVEEQSLCGRRGLWRWRWRLWPLGVRLLWRWRLAWRANPGPGRGLWIRWRRRLLRRWTMARWWHLRNFATWTGRGVRHGLRLVHWRSKEISGAQDVPRLLADCCPHRSTRRSLAHIIDYLTIIMEGEGKGQGEFQIWQVQVKDKHPLLQHGQPASWSPGKGKSCDDLLAMWPAWSLGGKLPSECLRLHEIWSEATGSFHDRGYGLADHLQAWRVCDAHLPGQQWFRKTGLCDAWPRSKCIPQWLWPIQALPGPPQVHRLPGWEHPHEQRPTPLPIRRWCILVVGLVSSPPDLHRWKVWHHRGLPASWRHSHALWTPDHRGVGHHHGLRSKAVALWHIHLDRCHARTPRRISLVPDRWARHRLLRR